MIFVFFGFDPVKIDEIMPKLVERLGLGHDYYSVLEADKIRQYDSSGKYMERTRAIWIPGFEKTRQNPGVLAELSLVLGVPITMVDAKVLAGIAGTLY